MITGSLNNVGYLEELNNNVNRDIRTFNLLNDIPYLDVLEDLDLNCRYYDESTYCNTFSSSKNISIFSLNIQSLAAKFLPFTNLIDKLSLNNAEPDFIMLQESFVKDIFHFNISNYKVVFNCRPPALRGGGTVIYCKEIYNIKQLSNDLFFKSNILESSVVLVDIPGKSKFILCSLYRPNTHLSLNSASQIREFFIALGEYLEAINNFNYPTIFGGDFNLNLFDINIANSNASELLDLFGGFGFINSITKATRVFNQSNTAIDQIFLNDFSILCRSGVLIDTPSDHFATFIEINLEKPKTKKDDFKLTRSFSVNNMQRFKTFLQNQSWVSITNSDCTNTACENFLDIFFNLYNLCFPISRVKINKKYHKINGFMTKGLLISRSKNIKLAQLAKKSPTAMNKETYHNYRGVYNKLIRLSKTLYHNRKVRDAGNNSRKLWHAIKEAINIPKKNNSIGPILNNETSTLLHNDTKKADYFNEFFSNIGKSTAQFIPTTDCSFLDFLPPPCPISIFMEPIAEDTFADFVRGIKPKTSSDINGVSMRFISSVIQDIKTPLTHIFNTSISNGIFPKRLKVSKCIPIFKSGDKTLVGNYRLVSLVDNFSKPIEKIICSRILDFLDDTNFFLDSQFGFRKGLSTKHAFLAIINYITKNINKDKYVLGIALDVMKAFDSVSYPILFIKLQNAGIRGIVLSWFKSYFEGREQKVFLNNIFSDNLCRITLGVLQGSILGVILFLIMINDIKFACPDLFSVIFADDDTSLAEDSSIEGVVAKANDGLERLVHWYSANKFAIHPLKSKCMLFHKSRSAPPPC